MALEFDLEGGGFRIELSGLDRAFAWRRSVVVDADQIVDAWGSVRGALEPSIDHRMLGRGPHDGAFRPGRRRIGSMLGHGVEGRQFWAMPASGPELPLLVLDLRNHEFLRIVAAIGNPYEVAPTLSAPDPLT